MATEKTKKTALRGHTGRTDKGHTRDVRIERIGHVTIYKRGKTYSLYYREFGKTLRRRVLGNFASAAASGRSGGQIAKPHGLPRRRVMPSWRSGRLQVGTD